MEKNTKSKINHDESARKINQQDFEKIKNIIDDNQKITLHFGKRSLFHGFPCSALYYKVS